MTEEKIVTPEVKKENVIKVIKKWVVNEGRKIYGDNKLVLNPGDIVSDEIVEKNQNLIKDKTIIEKMFEK